MINDGLRPMGSADLRDQTYTDLTVYSAQKNHTKIPLTAKALKSS